MFKKLQILGYYDVKISSNSAELNKEGDIDLFTQLRLKKIAINKILLMRPNLDKKIFFL